MCTTTFETAIAELEAAKKNVPQKIEFTVQDFADQLPTILSNAAELAQWASARTELDRNLVLRTDEDFDQARTRCAQLNKMIELVENKRKEVKRVYIQPYETFEREIKKTTDILTTAKNALWSQIKKAEEEVKAAKEEAYREYWNTLACTLRTWEQIFDKSWLNKTASYEQVKKKIDKIVQDINADVDVIRALNSEFVVELLDYYSSGHSLSEVVAKNNTLVSRKIELQDTKATTAPTNRTAPNCDTAPTKPVSSEQSEEKLQIDFRIWATESQLKGLKQYLLDNQIKYGKVPTNE